MGTWLKHDVTTIVNAPIYNVWNTRSDVDYMSLWMSWIESVRTIDQETSTLRHLTEWTVAADGVKVKRKAQMKGRMEKKKL